MHEKEKYKYLKYKYISFNSPSIFIFMIYIISRHISYKTLEHNLTSPTHFTCQLICVFSTKYLLKYAKQNICDCWQNFSASKSL